MHEEQTIVLINNEPTFRWTISRLLERRGMKVAPIERTTAAIDHVRATRPLAVVLEASYGSAVSAVSIVERLRGDNATRYLPIIVCSPDDRFLTSYGDYLRGEGCIVTGRPFDDDQFIDMIGRVSVLNTLHASGFTPELSHSA